MKTIWSPSKSFCAGLAIAMCLMLSGIAFGFGVDLRAKLRTINDEKEYLKGMPIIVGLHLINEDATRQFNWEQGEKAWGREAKHEEIRVKITTPDPAIGWYKYVTFEVNRISRTDDKITERENVGDLGLNANPMFYGCKNPEGGTLVDMSTARMKWCITPEATSTLVPGEYEIKVTFDNTSLSDDPDIYAGKFVSNAVIISLREPVNNDDQVKINLALARYYEKLQMYDKEIEAATNALKLDPECQRAHLILGDAYRISGDLAKAVAEYELYIAYLRTLPPSGSEDRDSYPDILESSVKAWKKKLGIQ